jgi:Branched-chain amino acid transport protein (AzlD)
VILIDRLLASQKKFSSATWAAGGAGMLLIHPMTQAFLLCVVPPAVMAAIVFPRIFGSSVGGFAWIFGAFAGFAVFLWRLSVVGPTIRSEGDRFYDEETRHILASEYRDTHSASFKSDKTDG